MKHKILILAALLLANVAHGSRAIEGDFIRSSDRATILNLPSTSDTMVGRTSTDTMTNKTLTSPLFTGMTAGSVYFAGAFGLLTQNNSVFFWDNTNKRLGLGDA